MLNRAYAVLDVKAVDGEKRIITGMATTPTPDRVGDIIDPMGVKFRNPMPLLHQHRSEMPVGTVEFDKPTNDGITFEARLPKIEDAGPLKDRVDTAWGEVKAGLVRGVSIGFKPIEFSHMDDGGIRFIESEVLELSLVTIPANAEATIQTIKSIDTEALAATGQKRGEEVSHPASREKSVKPKPKTKEKPIMAKTTAERISAFEAKREAKSARMSTLMEESGDETLDAADQEEYDTLRDEVKAVDEHLVRLNELAKAEASKAKPVDGSDSEKGSASRGGEVRVSVKEKKLPPGIRFARAVKCLGLSYMHHINAAEIAEKMYPDDTAVASYLRTKTAIGAGNTGTDAWAGALVGDETSVFADFVEYLRPMTILGKFGNNGVPSLRHVPFRVPLITQTTAGDGYWVGEGKAKPLTKFDFSRTTMLPLKVANIAVLTKEVIRDSNPAAETIVRDELAKALQARLDVDFIDPEKGAVSGVSPASITNGVTPITTSGTDAAGVRTDIKAIMAAYIAANNTPSSGVWIMSANTALSLALMFNALGTAREFPDITMSGGTLFGMPVITSEYIGYTLDSPSNGRWVFLVNAQDIYLADDGGIEVDMSQEASLEMSDAPAHNSTTPTAAQLVSLWQTNSVAFRAERTINWMRRRAEAVQVLQEVNWGA